MLGTLGALLTALTCKEEEEEEEEEEEALASRPLHQHQHPFPFVLLMAALLCALLSPPGVSAVTVVTQRPPVVRLTTGETANIDCNLGNVTNYTTGWLKQTPGGIPQFVMHIYMGEDMGENISKMVMYNAIFSPPHFESTCQSKTDCRLIINDVEAGDSAVYYCYTWDDTAKETVPQ